MTCFNTSDDTTRDTGCTSRKWWSLVGGTEVRESQERRVSEEKVRDASSGLTQPVHVCVRQTILTLRYVKGSLLTGFVGATTRCDESYEALEVRAELAARIIREYLARVG